MAGKDAAGYQLEVLFAYSQVMEIGLIWKY
jgi:hypothetical protein